MAVFFQVATAPCHPSPHESCITSEWQSSLDAEGGAVWLAVGAGDGTTESEGFWVLDGAGVGEGS